MTSPLLTSQNTPPLYLDLYRELTKTIDDDRLIRDPLRTLAYGTDASFYRLIPLLVVRVNDEAEVRLVLKEAKRRSL
ncbi:hypothetical protein V6238_19160, partial [Marinomonas arenicola]|uniref:hypothetical protein n=1 Tax=Marinomonas arenicola TaxID=569601 RepID=UPI00311F1069